jgi:hypothetical protein
MNRETAKAESERGGRTSVLPLTAASGIVSPLELSPAQLNARPLVVGQSKPPARAAGCASPNRRTAAERSVVLPEKERNGMETWAAGGEVQWGHVSRAET